MIADALAARTIQVRHILSASHAIPHKLTWAHVEGIKVTYPSTNLDLLGE